MATTNALLRLNEVPKSSSRLRRSRLEDEQAFSQSQSLTPIRFQSPRRRTRTPQSLTTRRPAWPPPRRPSWPSCRCTAPALPCLGRERKLQAVHLK